MKITYLEELLIEENGSDITSTHSLKSSPGKLYHKSELSSNLKEKLAFVILNSWDFEVFDFAAFLQVKE